MHADVAVIGGGVGGLGFAAGGGRRERRGDRHASVRAVSPPPRPTPGSTRGPAGNPPSVRQRIPLEAVVVTPATPARRKA